MRQRTGRRPCLGIFQRIVGQGDKQAAKTMPHVAALTTKAVSHIAQTAAENGNDTPCQLIIGGQEFLKRVVRQRIDDAGSQSLGIGRARRSGKDFGKTKDLSPCAQEKDCFLTGISGAKNLDTAGLQKVTAVPGLALKKNNVTLTHLKPSGAGSKQGFQFRQIGKKRFPAQKPQIFHQSLPRRSRKTRSPRRRDRPTRREGPARRRAIPHIPFRPPFFSPAASFWSGFTLKNTTSLAASPEQPLNLSGCARPRRFPQRADGSHSDTAVHYRKCPDKSR